MSNEATQALADLLTDAQSLVQQAGGKADVLGGLAGAWQRARKALGLAGRWHTREEALAAIGAKLAPAPSASRGPAPGAAPHDADLAAYMNEGVATNEGGPGYCPVCATHGSVQHGVCSACGSAVASGVGAF